MLEIAVSSLTYEAFEDNNYERLFANAYLDGYRNIEFNCWYADSLTSERMQFLKKQCEIHKLKPIALHVSGFGGNSQEDLSLNTAHKLRAIEAAVEIGCRRIVASACSDSRSLALITYELESIASLAEQKDVLVCLENHCNSILSTSEDYYEVLTGISSNNIGICLDGGHLEAAGEEIHTFIDKLGKRINHIHLKENRVFNQKSFCRFGNGGTDNKYMIEYMKTIGYSGYMSVELSPEVGETGDSVNFTDSDRTKPIELYSMLEE